MGLPPAAPPAFNLAAQVLAAGLAAPDRSALQVLRPQGAERWSHGRLRAAVLGAAAAFLARGLVPGDRVLLRSGNSPATPVAHLGAIAAGLVSIPTSAALTGPEITRIAAAAAPALILAEPGIALPDHPAPVLPADPAGWERTAPAPFHLGPPDRPAYIVFTSGSTGAPSGVIHAHRAILARAMMIAGWEGIGPGDRLLHAGAFNWTYTMGTGLMDPWTVGATALIPAPGTQGSQLPLLAARFDATVIAAAPGVFRRMLRATPFPRLPRLRHGLSAGEALPAPLRAAWEGATGTPLLQALGMTEISTWASEAPGTPAPPGATGWAQPGRRIAVVDAAGAPVPRGTPGILAVDAGDPGLMLATLDDPRAVAARSRGGWFLTGDLGVMGEEGALTFLGRADEVMNPGGHRVAPAEVEAALATHPALEEVAVAEVELAPGTRVIGCGYVAAADPGAAALAAHAAACLARWKQPRLWVRLDALPRQASSKIDRRALATLLSPRQEPPG
jgi:acyl-coenzyme A synthetase/AMP-(fatty) acid ligase